MIYLSDRRRVELALPASLFWRVCGAILNSDEDFDRQAIERLQAVFLATVNESFDDLAPAKRGSLRDRLARLRAAAMGQFHDRSIAVAYASAVKWIEVMTATGAITVQPGPFSAAFERLYDEIAAREENTTLLDDVDRSAQKAAKRMHATIRSFEGHGYFRDVLSPWESDESC